MQWGRSDTTAEQKMQILVSSAKRKQAREK
jgi:hypothetical protein